jgi:hypothetical protein
MTYQVFFFLRLPSDSLVAILRIDGEFVCNSVVGTVFKEISVQSIKVMANITFL